MLWVAEHARPVQPVLPSGEVAGLSHVSQHPAYASSSVDIWHHMYLSTLPSCRSGSQRPADRDRLWFDQ